jgi:hypothetical protein
MNRRIRLGGGLSGCPYSLWSPPRPQQRLALRRREADRAGGFTSPSHTETSQKEYDYVSCRQNGRATGVFLNEHDFCLFN